MYNCKSSQTRVTIRLPTSCCQRFASCQAWEVGIWGPSGAAAPEGCPGGRGLAGARQTPLQTPSRPVHPPGEPTRPPQGGHQAQLQTRPFLRVFGPICNWRRETSLVNYVKSPPPPRSRWVSCHTPRSPFVSPTCLHEVETYCSVTCKCCVPVMQIKTCIRRLADKIQPLVGPVPHSIPVARAPFSVAGMPSCNGVPRLRGGPVLGEASDACNPPSGHLGIKMHLWVFAPIYSYQLPGVLAPGHRHRLIHNRGTMNILK
jgi:hypothetical protein